MAESRPIVAIDIDDVLAQSAQAFVDFSNLHWGTQLSIDHYSEDWATMWGLNKDSLEHMRIVRERGNEALTAIIPTMSRIDDAYSVLKKLKTKAQLIVVTSRKEVLKPETMQWLDMHYPGIFHQSVVYFTGFYERLATGSWALHKGDMLRELGAHYLVDDQVKHCNGAAACGVKALLFGGYAHQSQSEAVDASVVPVRNWQAVEDFFDAELR